MSNGIRTSKKINAAIQKCNTSQKQLIAETNERISINQVINKAFACGKGAYKQSNDDTVGASRSGNDCKNVEKLMYPIPLEKMMAWPKTRNPPFPCSVLVMISS